MNSPAQAINLVVLGVVRDFAGRVLLGRSATRGWELPGGHVEPGETLPGALIRELNEETGCVITVTNLSAVYFRVCPEPVLWFVFRCAYASGSLRPSEELSDAVWLSPCEALRLIASPLGRGALAGTMLELSIDIQHCVDDFS